MKLARILAYFGQEAAVSLLRGWKVSIVAIATIAMSVFIGGTFLLLTGNLGRIIADWRSEARIVIYLRAETSEADRDRLQESVAGQSWITGVEEISTEEAKSRFQEVFPGVADLAEGWEEEPLPPSLELGFDASWAESKEFAAWMTTLREDPAILMVDDDRDWLRELEALVAVLRGLGFVVGAALFGAAIFTIASVIRLTAFLYREEIAVMRLVGATELFIRGPFYVEGLLQGLAGGIVAVVGLYLGFVSLDPEGATTSMLGTVLVREFLSGRSTSLLVGLGSLAGLLGSVISLRREDASAEA